MRQLLVLAIALSLLVAPRAASAAPTSPGAAAAVSAQVAPADEYFGRYSESVLEIRNRLGAFDAKSDADVFAPGAVEGLDNLADAISAWQHKYPGDPWIAAVMSHLMKCYARIGFASTPRATQLLGALLAAYPNASETKDALLAVSKALVPSTLDAPSEASVAGTVVDAATGQPIAGAVVVVDPNEESTDVTSDPFATTGADGSFVVKDVPRGGSYKGLIELAHVEYIAVEPPHGSSYAPYHGMVDEFSDPVAAGTIRLAAL